MRGSPGPAPRGRQRGSARAAGCRGPCFCWVQRAKGPSTGMTRWVFRILKPFCAFLLGSALSCVLWG